MKAPSACNGTAKKAKVGNKKNAKTDQRNHELNGEKLNEGRIRGKKKKGETSKLRRSEVTTIKKRNQKSRRTLGGQNVIWEKRM